MKYDILPALGNLSGSNAAHIQPLRFAFIYQKYMKMKHGTFCKTLHIHIFFNILRIQVRHANMCIFSVILQQKWFLETETSCSLATSCGHIGDVA